MSNSHKSVPGTDKITIKLNKYNNNNNNNDNNKQKTRAPLHENNWTLAYLYYTQKSYQLRWLFWVVFFVSVVRHSEGQWISKLESARME